MTRVYSFPPLVFFPPEVHHERHGSFGRRLRRSFAALSRRSSQGPQHLLLAFSGHICSSINSLFPHAFFHDLSTFDLYFSNVRVDETLNAFHDFQNFKLQSGIRREQCQYRKNIDKKTQDKPTF